MKRRFLIVIPSPFSYEIRESTLPSFCPSSLLPPFTPFIFSPSLFPSLPPPSFLSYSLFPFSTIFSTYLFLLFFFLSPSPATPRFPPPLPFPFSPILFSSFSFSLFPRSSSLLFPHPFSFSTLLALFFPTQFRRIYIYRREVLCIHKTKFYMVNV